MSWKFWQKVKNNTAKTSSKTIIEQMNELRPLPMGVQEFKEWSDRIISGALIPTTNKESLVATLAVMLQSLGPQESHKPDAYFIHSLRKAATNEVARHIFTQAKLKQEAEFKAAQEGNASTA
jgi:hypothetical protein